MEYGKLQVVIDYGDGFNSVATYNAYHFVNEGIDVSALMDVNSVDHAAQIHYDVNVMVNPGGIFGTESNITYTWVETPTLVGDNLENGIDMNDIKEPGFYYRSKSESESNFISNVPPMMFASTFVLEVLRCGSQGQILQRCTRCFKDNVTTCERFFYNGTWGEWVTTTGGKHLLAQPGMYMTEGHTVTLGEKVSEQENGIVLVFCMYRDGKIHDADFVHCPVSKEFVRRHPGSGSSFLLVNSTFSRIGFKYLYIHDDKITGHANNGKIGTGCGVDFTNNHWVLRYVLGD